MSEMDTPVELYGPDDGGWYTTRFHDWIGLCDDLRDPDVRGYTILRGLVVEKYKNPVRKLTLEILCELIPSGKEGKPSSLTRVRGILDNLSKVGLVSTPEGQPLKTSSRAAAARRPIRIRINDMPKPGYAGWRNAEAKLAFLVAQEAGRNSDPALEKGGGQGGAGRNSDPAGSNSDPRGRDSDPEPGSDLLKREGPLVPTLGTSPTGQAPAGRSPVDGRSPSTSGSSPVEDEGGSAASGNTKPASPKSRHSRSELETVDQVLAFLPPDIPRDKVRLPVVANAILSAMSKDCRSVEEMGQRINVRWADHGFAEKAAMGTLENPVGAVIAMVRPLRRGDRYACADIRCEDGRNLDTGEACRLCAVRAADWKAAQQRKREAASGQRNGKASLPAMPSQRAEGVPERPVMEDCSGPYCTRSIPSGTGPLCGDCIKQREAEAIGAALAAQREVDEVYAAEEAAAGAQIVAELEQEAAERAARAEAEAAERAAAEEMRRRLAAEEDARLREEFARQNPDLAAFSSQGLAPF
ncbi:hypothetical protein ACFY8X_39145 [Streptomyces tanashiensis]|uniref:hypothetical protein n=1 Tax=Streptomyces tanashiensis TaxID=67367 RepID=UPI0036E189E9